MHQSVKNKDKATNNKHAKTGKNKRQDKIGEARRGIDGNSSNK